VAVPKKVFIDLPARSCSWTRSRSHVPGKMRCRQSSVERGRSHSEIAPALEGRSAADGEHASLQTEGLTSSASRKKRSNAAHLAQELASSSPWSEAFLPASRTFRTFPTQHAAMSREQRGQIDNPGTTMAQPQQDTDPPPAYSNLPCIHELPATPVNTTPRTNPVARARRDTADHAYADAGQNGDPEEQELDVRAPLLGRVRRRWDQRGQAPWIQRGKTGTQRRCRLLAMVVVFSIILSIIVCALTHGFNEVGITFFGLPSIPTSPLRLASSSRRPKGYDQ